MIWTIAVIFFALLFAFASHMRGYYEGKRVAWEEARAYFAETNRELINVLHRAGISTPYDPPDRMRDRESASGSWTGLAPRPEDTKAPGTIPRWDEYKSRHNR